MNIQQNLNALLTMGAVGVRTSGAYQERQQSDALKKQAFKQDLYANKMWSMNENALDQGKFDPIAQQKELDAKKEYAETLEKQAKADPTKYSEAAYKAKQDYLYTKKLWEEGVEEQRSLKDQEEREKNLQELNEQKAQEENKAKLDAQKEEIASNDMANYVKQKKAAEAMLLQKQSDQINNVRAQRQNLEDRFGFEFPKEGKING